MNAAYCALCARRLRMARTPDGWRSLPCPVHPQARRVKWQFFHRFYQQIRTACDAAEMTHGKENV